MCAKQLAFDAEARDALRSGVQKLARAVKSTLGPRGRTAVLAKSWGAPTVTKDGVSVAEEIELDDKFENLGAQMVKEVASKTSDVAGDGTTTATVLAEAIYELGLKYMTAGANASQIRYGADKAARAVCEALDALSTPVKKAAEIAQVATISANGDEIIGKQIADAMEKVGKDGVITVEEGKTADTVVDIVEGMQFDRGFLSQHFVTDADSMKCEFTDCYVMLHEKKISSIQTILPILEKLAESGKPMLLIAEDIDGEALTTLVMNKIRGVFNVCAVKAPAFGERRKAMMEDLAVLTGGKAIFEDLAIDIDSLKLSDLGVAKKVIIDNDNTTIIKGAGSSANLKARINLIRAEIERSTSDYDREKLQERLAKLAGGVATIQVGATSESEVKEKKARFEDALHATRAAVEQGIVPGGGVALLRVASALDKLKVKGDIKLGVELVRSALELPIRSIANNAGVDGAVIARNVRDGKGSFGYDALNDEYVDMLKAGIVDPTKVTKAALTNAVSVSTLLLMTDCLITDAPKDDAPAMPEMG